MDGDKGSRERPWGCAQVRLPALGQNRVNGGRNPRAAILSAGHGVERVHRPHDQEGIEAMVERKPWQTNRKR